jgi:glycosyltransferase involved in cell wall biosynthesis
MRPSLYLFTDSREPSGVGEHILTLAAELAGRYQICISCPPTAASLPLLERAARLGVETCPLAEDAIDSCPRLTAWLRARCPDIFHCHAGIGWEGHAAIAAARAAGVPAIVRTEHLPYLLTDPGQQAAYAEMVRAVDRLLCVSQAAAATYIAAGVPAARIAWVANGIHADPAPLDRAAARRRLDLPDAPLVLTVGRFTEQKGHRHLLAAVPAVRAAIPAARFAWIGNGPLYDDLAAQIEAAGLAGVVELLGQRGDVATWMAAADLLVLPSLFEGLPLAVLEAMAAGRPVVGTRVVGTAEAVADGVTGRLVPPSDPAALAVAIVDVLQDPDRAARWGAAGRARVLRDFSAARMAAAVAATYAALWPPAPTALSASYMAALGG